MEEVHTWILWGNMRKTDHLEDPGIDGWIILRWFFRNWNVGAWIGLIWLRIWASGKHL
jgi:hypothetical protein